MLAFYQPFVLRIREAGYGIWKYESVEGPRIDFFEQERTRGIALNRMKMGGLSKGAPAMMMAGPRFGAGIAVRGK
jgi:hypothetical protein